ncbi:hypothetical protein VTK56DRAFT_4334 [Thermocarpiscus australiensis]
MGRQGQWADLRSRKTQKPRNSHTNKCLEFRRGGQTIHIQKRRVLILACQSGESSGVTPSREGRLAAGMDPEALAPGNDFRLEVAGPCSFQESANTVHRQYCTVSEQCPSQQGTNPGRVVGPRLALHGVSLDFHQQHSTLFPHTVLTNCPSRAFR